MTYSVTYERSKINDISQYGFDVSDELTKLLSEELAKEIDQVILSSLGIDTFDEKLKKLTDRLYGKE